MRQATSTNSFLLDNNLIKPEECPNGLTETPDEAYPFLAFFRRTIETRKEEHLKLAVIFDKEYQTTKYTDFMANIDEKDIFSMMMSYEFTSNYDEHKVDKFWGPILYIVGSYYDPDEGLDTRAILQSFMYKNIKENFRIKPIQ